MSGLPRNNLAEQLARYNAYKGSDSSATPLSEEKKRFTFHKVSQSESAPRKFTAPFKAPSSHTTLTRSFSDNSLSRPTQTAHAAAVSTPATTPTWSRANPPPRKITSFFGNQQSQSTASQKPSPPIAFVAPCPVRRSAGADEEEFQKTEPLSQPPALSRVTGAGPRPPGSALACSTSPLSPLSTNTTITISPPTASTYPHNKAVFPRSLEELRSERLQVMDEVCELLSNIPASKITSLFGLGGAGHIQKKLAVRKKLLSKEQDILKQLQADSSPSSHTSSVTPSPGTHPPPSTLASTAGAGEFPHRDWDMEDEDIFDSMAEEEEDFAVPLTVSAPSYTTTDTATHPFMGASNSTLSASANRCPTSYRPPGTTLALQSQDTGPHTTQSLAPHPHNPTHTATSSHSFSQKPLKARTGSTTDNSTEFRGPYPHSQEMMKIFTQVFGLQQFRPNQLEAVNAAILGEDCFILMPTGGGKSLCYQLPALMAPGVTIVVSPLRSLIQDQVQKLCSLEIPASHLSSDISASEESRVYASLSLRDPPTKLLYITPEKLGASNRLLSALQRLYERQRLARFVIDEAHCISQWGHDFRPDYKRLSDLKKHYPGVPIMALTATATPRVRADILHMLNLSSTKWFTQSFNRSNLQLSVVPKKPKKATQEIIELISSSFRGQSGIVYCLSRRDCELMAGELCKAGIAALSYHAGLSDSDRVAVQQRWLQEDHCKVVCATIAFGMGIDKPDVRFVIHHSLAKSVEGYYQEAGRAGRDGLPASCILFYAYSDVNRIRRMIKADKPHWEQEKIHTGNLYRMVQYCENEADCRRAQLLEYFAEKFDSALCKGGSTPCDNCQSQVPYRCEDVTDLVGVILESVQRVRSEKFTLVQFLEALRGSNSSRIANSELGSLPLYGKGSQIAKHDLERLLHMLVLKDILSESLHIGNHDNIICYVKTGSKAREVLSGRMGRLVLQIRGSKSTATAGSKSSGKNKSKEDQVRDECYKALLKLRMGVAQVFRMKNPENVFSSESLQAMCKILPTSKEGMMRVVGMTEARWKNFNGERFLAVTQEYASAVADVVAESPYWEGAGGSGSSKENRPTIGKGKRKSGAGSKRKKPAVVEKADSRSGDEFEPRPLKACRPGLMPPPKPMRTVKS